MVALFSVVSDFSDLRLIHSFLLGIEKVPGGVKLISWSPDGYCVAVAWQTHGLALWSVFGALLYTSLMDQTEVTRFLSPLNFVSQFCTVLVSIINKKYPSCLFAV